jgi:ligand-binding SRPBCC domain-containing protein
MAIIQVVTTIRAPRERCFDLARSIDLHTRSTAKTHERAVAGVTRGLIRAGEEVTWEAKHLGVRQRLSSRITGFDRPSYFQDTMLRGAFKRFVHDHFFVLEGDMTVMSDRLEFEAPLGMLGRLVDRVVLSGYLTRFLSERNAVIKRVAESEDEWKQFLI